MQSLACARTRFFTSYSHNLFSSAAVPTCGFRTLSHAHAGFAPLPTNPNAEPSSAYTFPSFSPLSGHRRLHPGAGYHHSLARFCSQQSSQPTSQPTVAAHAHVTVKTDEENENDKIVGSQHLQLTQRRQGFIGKVYGIVATQLLATAVVSSAVVFNPSLSQFILSSPPVYYSLFLGSLLCKRIFFSLLVFFVFSFIRSLFGAKLIVFWFCSWFLITYFEIDYIFLAS